MIDVPAYSSNHGPFPECRRSVVLSPWNTAFAAGHSGHTRGFGVLVGPSQTYVPVRNSWFCCHRCFPMASSAKPLHFKLSLPHRIPCLRCDESRPQGDRLARPCSERGHREELPDGYHQFRPHSFTGVVHLFYEYMFNYLGCAHRDIF